MKKILSVSLSVATAMLLTTGCDSKSQPKGHSKAHNESHWDYQGHYSPAHWGEMKEEFAMCSKGKMQTPINIIATQDVELKPLDLQYNASSVNVINNGHTVQVNIDNGSVFDIDGTKYHLKQFHFHTPSENNINGQEYPLEAHFVHATQDGHLAVVAVMFEEGQENPILSKIWSKFPLKQNQLVYLNLNADNIKAIMPKDKDYYKFMGSLTTPPCSENVKWFVLKTPVTISKEQVQRFYDLFGHSNNRPLQDRNNRMILE
jgi:carbonic anhydrase